MDIDDNPAVKFLNRHMAHFALAGFMLLCFYPIFSCWYYGDDVVSRNIHTVMQYENRSLYGFMANQMDYYIVKLGRFFRRTLYSGFLRFTFKHNNKIQDLYSCYEYSRCFASRIWQRLIQAPTGFFTLCLFFSRPLFLPVPARRSHDRILYVYTNPCHLFVGIADTYEKIP